MKDLFYLMVLKRERRSFQETGEDWSEPKHEAGWKGHMQKLLVKLIHRYEATSFWRLGKKYGKASKSLSPNLETIDTGHLPRSWGQGPFWWETKKSEHIAKRLFLGILTGQVAQPLLALVTPGVSAAHRNIMQTSYVTLNFLVATIFFYKAGKMIF